MMLRRKAALGVFLVALFGLPRPGHAGILELIWELSGPQMIGAGYSCLFRPPFQKLECKLGAAAATALPTTSGKAAPEPPRAGELLFVLGGSAFVSTGKDSKTQEYSWFDANMAAVEPGVVVFSRVPVAQPGWRIGHGAGVSYGVLFGENFRRFDKFAFTITPIEFAYGKFAVGAKFRIYPNGFTDDEFGFGPRLDIDRPVETTIGFGISYIFR